MTEMATVSAKIEKRKKEEMDELGISPSEVIKKAIDEAIIQRRREKAAEGISEVVPIIRKVSKESWVKAIRETRDER